MLTKAVVAFVVAFLFLFCRCLIVDNKHPFRDRHRLEQLEMISDSFDNQFVLCLELLDTIIFLRKKRPKNEIFETIVLETVKGRNKTFYLVERPFL